MSSSEPESSPPLSPAPGDIPPPAPSPPLGPQPSAPPSALCSPRSDPRPPQLLKCTRCARTLATISAIGDFEVAPPSDPCALCEDMAKLHGELLEQTRSYEELEHRRPNYGPRMWAIIYTNRAQIALRNFLDRVAEAVVGSADEQKGDGDGEEKDAGNGEQIIDESEKTYGDADLKEKADHEENEAQDQMSTSNGEEQQDESSRGLSSHSNYTSIQDAGRATTKRARHSPSPSPSSHHHKRVRLSLSLPTSSGSTHRVHFAPSVIFRSPSDMRWNADFSRNSERYRPGRYAAPAGRELLDTSGCSMKESEFFGMMKRGKKWVPTPRGLQLDDEWEGGASVDRNKDGGADGDGDQEMAEADEETDEDPAEEEEEFDEEGFERAPPAVGFPGDYWVEDYKAEDDEGAHDGGTPTSAVFSSYAATDDEPLFEEQPFPPSRSGFDWADEAANASDIEVPMSSPVALSHPDPNHLVRDGTNDEVNAEVPTSSPIAVANDGLNRNRPVREAPAPAPSSQHEPNAIRTSAKDIDSDYSEEAGEEQVAKSPRPESTSTAAVKRDTSAGDIQMTGTDVDGAVESYDGSAISSASVRETTGTTAQSTTPIEPTAANAVDGATQDENEGEEEAASQDKHNEHNKPVQAKAQAEAIAADTTTTSSTSPCASASANSISNSNNGDQPTITVEEP